MKEEFKAQTKLPKQYRMLFSWAEIYRSILDGKSDQLEAMKAEHLQFFAQKKEATERLNTIVKDAQRMDRTELEALARRCWEKGKALEGVL